MEEDFNSLVCGILNLQAAGPGTTLGLRFPKNVILSPQSVVHLHIPGVEQSPGYGLSTQSLNDLEYVLMVVYPALLLARQTGRARVNPVSKLFIRKGEHSLLNSTSDE